MDHNRIEREQKSKISSKKAKRGLNNRYENHVSAPLKTNKIKIHKKK